MNWHSAQEFFQMGGYGFYVWGSYLMAAVCIAIEVVALRRRSRTLNVRSGLTAEPRSPHR